MDEKEKEKMLQTENYEAGWHEEALARANQEGKDKGLKGEALQEFVRQREPEIFDELKKL
jgi:hypothetical protein